MKIRIVGNWEFRLIAETKKEEEILHKTFESGHIHFVAKALIQKPRQKRAHLLIAPSCFSWYMKRI